MMRVAHLFLSAVMAVASVPLLAAEVPIKDFARHPKFNLAKISPDGQYLAVTGIVGGKTVLALVHLSDMKTVNIEPRSREDVNEFWWVAPDRVMYTVAVHFGSIVNPSATGELFTVNADGSNSNIIFGLRVSSIVTGNSPDAAVSQRATGELVSALRDDRDHAIIASYPWATHSGTMDVFPAAYRIDLRDGRKTALVSAPARGTTFLADHTGMIRFAYASAGAGTGQHNVYYRKDLEGPWEPVVDETMPTDTFVPLMFDRSNTSVYAQCPGENKVGGICRWDVATRKLAPLWSARDSSLAELVPTFDGMDAFAIRTSVGRPATTLIDKTAPEKTVLVELMKQFPGVDIQFSNASSDGRKVVFLAQGDDDPGVYYLYETQSRKITRLLDRRPWIKPQQMAHMEPVSLQARDGLALHGYLTRPLGKESAKNLPLVMLVHGGPFGIWDNWGFDSDTQLLASRGYAVLQVNFRGSGGYGYEFMRAGYREWGGKMQDDVTDATRWAIEQGIADPHRVCIYGASYGGYAALEGTVKEPELYNCAIGYVGIYDLRAWAANSDVARTRSGPQYIEAQIGTSDAELWERSPLAHVERIKARIMLVVGGADERVPKSQGENLRAALIKHDNPPEWVYERLEGHGFYAEDDIANLDEKLLAFLDRQIGSAALSAKR